MGDKFNIAFNTNFVASLTDTSVAMLNSWDKKGIVSPSILKSSGRGSIRLYSFKDIVEIKTVAYLRQSKISLKQIKNAIDYLKNLNFNSPLSEMVLVSNGIDILTVTQGELNGVMANWIAANKYGQRVMPFIVPIGGITQSIDDAVAHYNKRIEEAEKAEKENKLVSFEDIEETVFGVSSKVDKKRA